MLMFRTIGIKPVGNRCLRIAVRGKINDARNMHRLAHSQNAAYKNAED